MKFKRNTKNTLQYESKITIAPNFLIPAKKFVPEWYKNAPNTMDKQVGFKTMRGLKYCVPFLDALTCGYYLTTPVDIYVEQRQEGPWLTWGLDNTQLMDARHPGVAPTIPIPPGFNSTHLIWKTQGVISVPKGCSVLFTHPLNRTDLPFYTLSGIVDDFLMYGGNIPFFIKEGFTGPIPAGIPFLQVIPFRREAWHAEETKGLNIKSKDNEDRALAVWNGWYKKNIWKKKEYN